MRLERASAAYAVTKLKPQQPTCAQFEEGGDEDTCADEEQAALDAVMEEAVADSSALQSPSCKNLPPTVPVNVPTATTSADKALIFQADQEFRKQQQVEIQNLVDYELGFSLVVQELVRFKKPLVGHNLFLDLLFLYQ